MKSATTRFLMAFMALILMSQAGAGADDGVDLKAIKKNLQEQLGANNVGKEFWISNPPCYEETAGNNFVKIFITSPVRTQVIVEVPGKGFYRNQMTIPNDVIQFDLPPSIGQPITKSTQGKPYPEEVYVGAGVHIYADDPIVVYCVVRFQATSDGYLAIPVSALGKEYIVAAYDEDPMFKAVWNIHLPSTTCIIAPHDKTKVTFIMGGNYMSKTAGGMTPGDVVSKTLNEGDVWMFMSYGDGVNADLTGSRVFADKPIALVSGNQCTNIPIGNQWCDYTVEMQLPTSVWGKHYHVAKVPGRKFPSILRVFAKETNTEIFRDGKSVSKVKDVGGVIGRGFQEFRIGPLVEDQVNSAVISGDKPIGVTLYNCGVQEDGYPLPNSDPFTEVQTPIEQYQDEITFCTPATFGGDFFMENYLNVVYETDESGVIPPDLLYAEVSAGRFEWIKVRDKFPGTGELFKYEVDGRRFGTHTLTLPTVGVFKIKADKPFAAYSYGYDWCDSYGYPTSAALADLEKPDTIPPAPEWKMECDGNVNIDEKTRVTDYPNDPEVRSNLAKIVFFRDSSMNYDLWYNDFIPGIDYITEWGLNIINPEEDARALIGFTDRRGNDTLIDIYYYAVKLEIVPKEWDFGKLKLNEEKFHDFKVVNKGKGDVHIMELKLKSNNQNFELTGYSLPTILPAGGEMPFKVKFTGVEPGYFKDSIGVGDTCFFWNKAFVEASVGQPEINADDHDYGDVRVGNGVNHEFHVWNTGSSPIVITGYSGPTNSVYKLTDMIDISETNPLILQPGFENGYAFNVRFTPDAVQAYPDKIIFHSDAAEIDSVNLIAGRGIAPGLIANSYDWGRQRVGEGPYDFEGAPGDQIITLRNDGTAPVKVYNLKIESDYQNRGAAFEFDRNAFKNLTIKENESVTVIVRFNPQVVGVHELVISYENDAGSDTKTTLKGIGIRPKIATNDADFGTTLVDDPNPNGPDNAIVFTNTPWTDPVDGTDVSDELTLSGFVVNPNGGISDDAVNYGSEGFVFDRNNIEHSNLGIVSLDNPIVLQPGESIEIKKPEFVAQKTGSQQASITSITDCWDEAMSVWTGNGIMQGISATGGSSNICVWEEDIITCNIQNTGDAEILVTSLSLDPAIPEFQFVNPADVNGFTLVAGQPKDIQIRYVPTVEMPKTTVELVVENNSLTQPEIRTEIDGTSVHYDRTTSSGVSGDGNYQVSESFSYGIFLDDNGADNNHALAGVYEMDVTIQYKNDFFDLAPGVADAIDLGADYKNGFKIKDGSLDIRIADNQNNIKEISFTIESVNGEQIMKPGQLVLIKFWTFLPYYTEEQDGVIDIKQKTTEISHLVSAPDTKCVDYTSTPTSATLLPVCVNDMRQVVLTNQEYGLIRVSPNPVGSSGADVTYSVGMTGYTEICIINSLGNIVDTPVAKVVSTGEYTFRLPIDKLPSGVYMVRMKSGPFEKSEKLVIDK